MRAKYHMIFFLFIAGRLSVYCQGNEYGPGYQLTLIGNPGLTGTEGIGSLRLSYLNLYPGNNYNLHSINVSYDAYFSSLHGGAGFYVTNNNLSGIINDLSGGFSYAYHFQAGSNLFVSAGLSASLFHRGYNFSGAVLPDQIDPVRGAVLPSGEKLDIKGRSVLDLSTGFLMISGRFFGGISVSHLTEPDPDGSGNPQSRISRRLLLHAAGDIDLNEDATLKIRPLIKMELEREYMSAGAGAVLESKHLSVSSVFLMNNHKDLDLQAGFALASGIVTIFYNYRINISSGNNFLPLSLLHHTGVALSLNNVEKRKAIRTINFPRL
jgi:type IX secretion system PorP/SprF family membrane protein